MVAGGEANDQRIVFRYSRKFGLSYTEDDNFIGVNE